MRKLEPDIWVLIVWYSWLVILVATFTYVVSR